MRFMCMHKVTPSLEACAPPDPAMMEACGKLIAEQMQKGIFHGGEGLGPSTTRSRVTCRNGDCIVEHGVKGRNELLAGFLMLKVKDRDEAIEWARRYAKVVGDVELGLGPITEPWDMGMGEKPPGAPLRVLLLHMSDAEYEAGGGLAPRKKGELTKLKDQMAQAGVLMAAETLAPSSRSKRCYYKADGKYTIVDGPFAESKEMIAGYAILDYPDIDTAAKDALRFISIFGEDNECDIRPIE